MTGQPLQMHERIASAAQYALLGGFASTAAGISAQGLTGFARSNMGLRGIVSTREAYRKYIGAMLTLSGAKDADKRAGGN